MLVENQRMKLMSKCLVFLRAGHRTLWNGGRHWYWCLVTHAESIRIDNFQLHGGSRYALVRDSQ